AGGRARRLAALERVLEGSLTANRLPRWAGAVLAPACLLVAALLQVLSAGGSPLGVLAGGVFAYLLVHPLVVLAVEGARSAVGAGCHDLCAVAFGLTALPLVALLVRAVPAAAADPGEFLASPVVDAVGGTAATIVIATAVSVPVGLACAVWSSEYASRRSARIASSLADAAVSVPSLVAGLLVLMLFILVAGPARAPGRAGAVIALCALMIPYIMRGATGMLGLVPTALREQGLALGAQKRSVILRVVLPAASAGLVSSAVLAVSRAIGAASLMLVVAGPAERPALNSLPVWITGRFTAGSASGRWAGALWLVAIVVVLDLVARAVPARLGPKDGT
ncbi:ABC transporter permease subunit, partial [uncultured Propionibacterium sp.]|uniref:ABC transporter permease subunit n=1 Tax=uncultured Propionibacterium sp. TaxID=218066 RepID=UPI00292E59D9